VHSGTSRGREWLGRARPRLRLEVPWPPCPLAPPPGVQEPGRTGGLALGEVPRGVGPPRLLLQASSGAPAGPAWSALAALEAAWGRPLERPVPSPGPREGPGGRPAAPGDPVAGHPGGTGLAWPRAWPAPLPSPPACGLSPGRTPMRGLHLPT